MSKQKRNIIAVILCIITLAIAIGIFLITNKASPQNDNVSEFVSSNEYSTVNVEDIESEKETTDNETKTQSEIEFIEPDETKADKILEESKKKKNTSSVSMPTTASKTETTKESSSNTQVSKPSDNSSDVTSSKEENTERETDAEK